MTDTIAQPTRPTVNNAQIWSWYNEFLADWRSDQASTVLDLLHIYRLRKLSQLRTGSSRYRSLSAGLDSLLQRDVLSLTRRDISRQIATLAETAPIHANRTLAYIKAFFSWAVGEGYLDTNPAAPVAKPVREKSRERTPTLGEIAIIWKAADGLWYPFGPIVHLLILTASRRSEIGEMRVDELDLPDGQLDGCWTIPAARSKNGRAIRIPLCPLARQVITRALQDRSRPASEYVFTTTGDRPVSGWSKAKARLDYQIGIKGFPAWCFHDFRRSFATHACDHLQIPPAVADRCLNHVGSATSSTISRVYARNEMFEERKDALARWAVLISDARAELERTRRENSPTIPPHRLFAFVEARD
jgi:integrase